VQFWVGAEFHAGFLRDLRHRSASMATLVSLAPAPRSSSVWP
jgi:cation transport ATPase